MSQSIKFKVSKPSQKLFFVSTPKKNESIKSTKHLFKIKKPNENKFKFKTYIQKNQIKKTLYDPIKNQNYLNSQILQNQQLKFKKRIKYKFSVTKVHNQTIEKLKKLKEKPKKKNNTISEKETNYLTGRWNLEEHKKFIEAIIKFGNNWKLVQKHIKTRSSTQARSHAQKFFIKLKKAKLIISNNNFDLTNSSIKMLHEALNDLNQNEYEKIFEDLNNVFDKKTEGKKRKKRSKSTNFNSDSNDLMNSDIFESKNLSERISDVELDDYDYLLINNTLKNYIPKSRKQSVDFINEKRRRNSFNSLNEDIHKNEYSIVEKGNKETFGNFINENDYLKNFNLNGNNFEKLDLNDNNNRKPSRKVSLDDDFIYNTMNI